ncbi:MAG: hypothetical protein IJT79_05285 [Ruminococcus sp.]|nr:hypothetical protein [Ruminococcus sp.]
MRALTFKSYLERQMCELSGASGKSLYRFSAMCGHNARLKDAVVFYISLFTKKDLKAHLIKKYPYLSEGCAKLSNIKIDGLENNLSDPALSEYKTIYDNYLVRKNNKANEDKIKLLMHEKIVAVQGEKRISNYSVYKNLNLNPGNANAFLKNGDVSKLSLDIVRRILQYVNETLAKSQTKSKRNQCEIQKCHFAKTKI